MIVTTSSRKKIFLNSTMSTEIGVWFAFGFLSGGHCLNSFQELHCRPQKRIDRRTPSGYPNHQHCLGRCLSRLVCPHHSQAHLQVHIFPQTNSVLLAWFCSGLIEQGSDDEADEPEPPKTSTFICALTPGKASHLSLLYMSFPILPADRAGHH